MKSNFDISKIKFSRSDIDRRIKIPIQMNKELAELIGIIIGDGHLIYPKSNNEDIYHYHLDISGHIIDDIDYYKNIVEPIFIKLFGIKLRFTKQRKTELNVKLDSKAILTFLHKILNIPTGNKVLKVKIPDYIENSQKNNIKIAFLRGLVDTDFCITFKKRDKQLHYYPVINCQVRSKKLIKQLSKYLKSLGFKIYTGYDQKTYDPRINKYITEHIIDINGKSNLEKWMNLIGFDNPKHITKYQVWKKFGFCPPYTNIEQRKKILKGQLNPHSFYKN